MWPQIVTHLDRLESVFLLLSCRERNVSSWCHLPINPSSVSPWCFLERLSSCSVPHSDRRLYATLQECWVPACSFSLKVSQLSSAYLAVVAVALFFIQTSFLPNCSPRSLIGQWHTFPQVQTVTCVLRDLQTALSPSRRSWRARVSHACLVGFIRHRRCWLENLFSQENEWDRGVRLALR